MKEYEQYRKKYGLPSFEELDAEFDLSGLEVKEFLVRDVKKKIVEKLVHTTEFVEGILQSDTAVMHIYESAAFTDSDRKAVFELYKKLAYFERYALETVIKAEEPLDAKFIKDFYAEWKILKKEAARIVQKTKDFWSSVKETKNERKEYMG